MLNVLKEVMSMDDDADIALMLGADPQHADDKLAEKIQKYKMLSNKLDDRKCIPAHHIELQLSGSVLPT